MKHPRPLRVLPYLPLLRLLPFLFAAFALLPNQSQAQLVLESGGVESGRPSIIEVRSSDGTLDVQEITGRATATARAFGRYGSGRATARAESTQHVCETPCRFQLSRPMELRIDAQTVRLTPDGHPQRFLVEPQNTAGLVLGTLGMSLGGASLVSGALLLGLDRALFVEGDDGEMGDLGVIFLGVGAAVFLIGLIARIASKGSIQRVDRFDF